MGCIPHTMKAAVKSEPPMDLFDFMESDQFDGLLDEMEIEPTKNDANLIPSYRGSMDSRDWTDNIVDYVFGGESNREASQPIAGEYDNNARDANQFHQAQTTHTTEQRYFASVKQEAQSSEDIESAYDKESDQDDEESLDGTATAIVLPSPAQLAAVLPSLRLPPPSTDTTEEDDTDDSEDVPYEIKFPCKKSLFSKSAVSSAKPPWELEDATADDSIAHEYSEEFTGDRNIELMSQYEENETYKRLRTIFVAVEANDKIIIPTRIRRYYRKLCVRRMKRNLGKPVFDVDNYKRLKYGKAMNDAAAILDRFHHQMIVSSESARANLLHARLSGACHHDMFISPHTGRVLHPFIHRSDECLPPWVQLMCELQYTVNDRMPSRASIDYCYVRPQHIAAVNALLQRLFWPGIDSTYFA